MREKAREHLDLVLQQMIVAAEHASGKGDGDAWDPEREPLHRGGDGPGVENVLAHVRPVIDAAQHEVRTLGQQRLDRHHDAVGRGPVDLPPTLPELNRAQRVVQREGVARRALLSVGGDDPHLAEGTRRPLEDIESPREDTVIVAAQDPHQGLRRAGGCRVARMSLRSFSSWRIDCRSSACRAVVRNPPSFRRASSCCRAPSTVNFSV